MTAGPLTARLRRAADAADADPDTDGVWLATRQLRALLNLASVADDHPHSPTHAEPCPICVALNRLEETP